MKINPQKIKVSELVANYKDDGEFGVRGYHGRLNIRPAFQREFIYGEKERNAVINTVLKGYPLNTMYWAVVGDDFELMDGQQRTVSICQYVQGNFSIDVEGNPMGFGNLSDEKKNQILDYDLTVYFCDGTDDEKLEWFQVINIAGKPLYPQELRNAIYTGPWLADAKRWFSKRGGPAVSIADKFVKAEVERQGYLETALDWISGGGPDEIKKYMADHQQDQNANELWTHFQNVINWVNLTFTNYRKEMRLVDWGPLYKHFKDTRIDTAKLENEIARLMQDEDVTKKSGIYDYVLTKNERSLSIRAFTDNMKREAYERQKGICPACNNPFPINSMQADHIKPWHAGGKTIAENCQMLCEKDNRTKGGK